MTIIYHKALNNKNMNVINFIFPYNTNHIYKNKSKINMSENILYFGYNFIFAPSNGALNGA